MKDQGINNIRYPWTNQRDFGQGKGVVPNIPEPEFKPKKKRKRGLKLAPNEKLKTLALVLYK